MKNYDLYQLREEGVEDGNMAALKKYALLERARLLEEVGKFGFMCDWNDFKVGETLTAVESCTATFFVRSQ